LVERLLETIHHTTGMSWGPSIVLYTVALKLVLLPFNVMQLKASAKSRLLRPKVDQLRQEMNAITSNSKTASEDRQKKAEELAKFMSDNGISPFRTLGSTLIQAPVFMATFIAIKNMASQPLPSMAHQPFLWISDITQADPTWMLPASSSVLLLIAMEVSRRAMSSNSVSPFFKIALRCMALGSLPFISHLPAAIITYFTTSNAMNLAINIMWLSNRILSVFGLPTRTSQVESAVETPRITAKPSAAALVWMKPKYPQIIRQKIHFNRP